MTEPSGPGYIYIPNWGDFQHYKDRRPAWIKTYLDLLDNDAYLDLSVFDRGVLHAIWLLVARVGQGRCSASAAYLQRQCRTPAGHMQRSLERLNQAGFIEVRSSKALAIVYPVRTTEKEGSKEPIEKERARASSPQAAHPRTPTPSMNGHLDAADIGRRRNKVRNHYQGVLLENGADDAREWLEENHPDLVDTIIGHAKDSA